MKKGVLALLIVVATGSALFITYRAYAYINSRFPYMLMSNSLEKHPTQDILAVYDPEQEVPEGLQHYLLKIKIDSDWEISKSSVNEITPEVPVLLTFELYGNDVLNDFTRGAFDDRLKKVLKEFKQHQDLYIRFNPEMDLSSSRKPWANWGGVYVTAFKKFSAQTRRILPEAKVVWSPAGATGNMEYYPGSDFFEAASISLGMNDKNDLFLAEKSLAERIDRKFYRMRFLHVPLWF